MSRQPTEEEKQKQREVLKKYSNDQLIDLLIMSKIDVYNIRCAGENQHKFLKTVQKDLTQALSKLVLGDNQIEELIKMMQTTKGVAFSNNSVLDTNITPTEEEYQLCYKQLSNSSYKNFNAVTLYSKLNKVCEKAKECELIITNGKKNWKQWVIRKYVLEHMYQHRLNAEKAKLLQAQQIAEIRERRQRSDNEDKQKIKALKDGTAMTSMLQFQPPPQLQYQQQPQLQYQPQYQYQQPQLQYQQPQQLQYQQPQQLQYQPLESTLEIDYSDDLDETEQADEEDMKKYKNEEYINDGFCVPDMERLSISQNKKGKGKKDDKLEEKETKNPTKKT